MAVLLVTMAIMAVLMTAVMPVWKQMAQREKEAELVFRGQQYARAIGLYGRKYANAAPSTIDVLLRERFLRKKYKDPITNADFVPIPAGGTITASQQGRRSATPALPGQASTSVASGRSGIVGVTSASTARSIRMYNGATHYNEWRFVYVPTTLTPGAGAPGVPVPGRGRGGPEGESTPPVTPGRGR